MKIHRKLLSFAAAFTVALSLIISGASQTGNVGNSEGKDEVKRTYTIESNELKLPSPVVFVAGSTELKPESDKALEYVKNFLNDKPYITLLRIEGHCDEGDAMSQALSEKRALVIVRKLISQGIACERLLAVGFGATKPVVAPEAPDANAKNTRLAFVMATMRNRAIGGLPADGGGKVAGDSCQK